MRNQLNQTLPDSYLAIKKATQEIAFHMPSDIPTGTLLKSLAASKPSGNFLELGTGTGLSTAWILDGMDSGARLTSLDNDESLLAIAKNYLSVDERLSLVHTDGESWIETHSSLRFDYIFADTWPGKYLLLEEVLQMLNPGGFYLIDDMLPQPNWPDGHAEKASLLIKNLESRNDLHVCKLDWATGIVIAVKK
jgi:predicted O-methyltransferase YrrM